MRIVSSFPCTEVVPFCVVRCSLFLTYLNLGVSFLHLPLVRAYDGWRLGWCCCTRRECRLYLTVSSHCHTTHLSWCRAALSLRWQKHTHASRLNSSKDTEWALMGALLLPVQVCWCFIPRHNIRLLFILFVYAHTNQMYEHYDYEHYNILSYLSWCK